MHYRSTHATAVAAPDRRFSLLACALIVALVATLALPGVALGGKPTPPPEPENDPIIDAITPDSAMADEVVTITGSYFGDGTDSDVLFQGGRNGRTATVVTWTDTMIEVEVPDDAEDGDVTVVIQDDWVSNGVAFTVAYPNPVIDAITPDAAPAGDVVTITGSGFGEAHRDSTVEFPTDRRTTDGDIVSWTDTVIEVEVPSDAVAGLVTVTVLKDYVSQGIEFTPGTAPAADPIIDAITPPNAPIGDVITITGSNFGEASDTSFVEFWKDGGEVTGDIVSWTDTTIEVEVPNKTVEGYVRVWVNEFFPSNGVYFVPAADPPAGQAPVIDYLSSYAEPVGDSFIIYGSFFGEPDRDSDVVFRDKNDDPVNGDIISWTDTQIEVEVPRNAVTGYLGVVVADYWVSNGVYFVVGTMPQVTAVSPTSAPAGSEVVFTGSGFGDEQGDGYPTFAGVPGDVVAWSDTEVIAIVPEGALAGYGGIVQSGIVSNGVFFVPFGTPNIDSVSADVAFVGDRVTVTGSGFQNTPGTLAVGGVACDTVAWSDTEITFEVPGDVPNGYIGVTQDGATSNGKYLTVGAHLTALSDWWGPEGAQVTVFGEGFGATQADVRVTVGGVDATIDSWSPTAITFTIPNGVTSGYVGVIRDWVCSNGIYLVVEDRATITSVDTTTVQGGQIVTIEGTGFGPETATSVVAMDGRFIFYIVSWSDTLIVAQAPAVVESSYIGVIKQGVTSNGIWLDVAP